MKKRILSMLLAVITVVAMIPAALVTAIAEEATPTPGYADGYDVFVSDIEPTLDGTKDAVYGYSETIVNTSTHNTVTGHTVGFEANVVLTDKGFYLFADIADNTIRDDEADLTEIRDGKSYHSPKLGDKFTLFLQVANTVAGKTEWAWGYFDTDYATTTETFDYFGKTGNFSSKLCKPQIATTTTKGKGYTIEFFLPWENCALEITNKITTETVNVYFGLQVNNHSGTDAGTNQGYCYDNASCSAYYHGKNNATPYEPVNNTTAPKNLMIKANPVYSYYDGYDVYVSDTVPTPDGILDDVYKKGELITCTHPSGDSVTFDAYALATEESLYFFITVKEYGTHASVSKTNEQKYSVESGDKVQIYLQIANTDASGKTIWSYGYFEMDYANSTINKTSEFKNSSVEVGKSVDEAADSYTIELKMDWKNCSSSFGDAEVSPRTVDLYFGIQVNNYDVSTNNGIAYDNPDCPHYWWQNSHHNNYLDGKDGSGSYNSCYEDYSGAAPYKSMIPANFVYLTDNDSYGDGYDAAVTFSDDITVDGNMDAIYESSEEIQNGYYKAGNGFRAYTAVTQKGLYVYTDIKDRSANGADDYFRVDLEAVYNVSKANRGYVELTRNGVIKTSSSLSGIASQIKKAVVSTADGWQAELFIPWTYITTNIIDLNLLSPFVGFEVGYDAVGTAVNETRTNAAKNKTYVVKQYTANHIGYDTTSTTTVKLNLSRDVYSGSQSLDSGLANIPAFSVYQYTGSITVDGICDEVYLKSQKISEKKVDGSGTGFDSYIIATESGLYIYSEIEDTSVDNASDKIRFYFTDEPNRHATNTYNSKITGTETTIKLINNLFATQTLTYLDITVNGTKSGVGFVDNGLNTVTVSTKTLPASKGWVAEAYIPWASMTNYADEIAAKADTTAAIAKATAAAYNSTEKTKLEEAGLLDDAEQKIADYVNTSVNALKAPYKCAIGISAHNGTNVSYSNARRTEWENAPAAYNYVTNYAYGGENENKKNDSDNVVEAYYVPLTYTSFTPGVRNVYVTNDKIKLDGTLDDIYKNSSKVIQENQLSGNQRDVNFTSYTVANLDGLYIWLITDDATLNNIHDADASYGDMVQIYFDWTLNYRSHEMSGLTGSDYYAINTTNPYFRGGWLCFDYAGYKSSNHAKAGQLLNLLDFKVVSSVDTDKTAWNKANAETNYTSGYAIEVFLPWDDEMRDQIGKHANDIHMGLGIQVSDDATYNWGGPEFANELDQKYNGDYRTNVSYCDAVGGSYFSNYEMLPDINFIYEDDLPDYNRFVVDKVSQPVVVDGKNTNGEYDYAKIVRANIQGRGTADDGDMLRVVYDGESISILVELEDNTPSYDKAKFGQYADYVDLAIVFDDKYTTMTTFYRSANGVDLINDDDVLHPDASGHPNVYLTGLRWYNYDSALDHIIDFEKSKEANKVTYKDAYIACTDSPYGWTYELKIPLTDAEKAKIENGTFVLGIAGQFLDSFDTDGIDNDERNYKYTVKDSGVYTGDNAMNESYRANNATAPSELYKFSYFSFAENHSKLLDANVALGESITVNYRAIAPAGADSVVMKFTMNSTVVLVEGIPTEYINDPDGTLYSTQTNQYAGCGYGAIYVFPFEGVAPQCIGDNIKAELYVDGILVGTKENYSVLENVNNIKKNYDKWDSLIDALLHYGAAAQDYADYKDTAEELVNKGLATPDYMKDGEAPYNNDKDTGDGTAVPGARFSAAGIHHYSTNKIYVKVKVDPTKADVSNLTVTFDGKPAIMELFSDGATEDVYIIYSDAIKVANFDHKYEVVLSDGTNKQTLTYSVNAYSVAKWGNSSPDVVNKLARAMYGYGAAAKAFLGG